MQVAVKGCKGCKGCKCAINVWRRSVRLCTCTLHDSHLCSGWLARGGRLGQGAHAHVKRVVGVGAGMGLLAQGVCLLEVWRACHVQTSAALRLYLYQRATKLGHWCKLGHSCCVAQTVLLASLHTASLHTTSPPACHTSGRWQGEQAKKNGNQSLKACQHAPVNGMAGQPSARQSPSVQTKTTSRSICSTLGCRK